MNVTPIAAEAREMRARARALALWRDRHGAELAAADRKAHEAREAELAAHAAELHTLAELDTQFD